MRSFLNMISKLKVNGEWVMDKVRIRDFIEEYFLRLYYEPFPNRLEVEGVDFNFISEDQQRWLEDCY